MRAPDAKSLTSPTHVHPGASRAVFGNLKIRYYDVRLWYRIYCASANIGLAFWLHWHGWHAFRRGLATNLHELGTDDKEIQGILRHSDVRLTQNIYIKSVDESQVDAMDTLSQTYNDLAAKRIQ